MPITARCNNAGPLATSIPTRSFIAVLLARLNSCALSRLRW